MQVFFQKNFRRCFPPEKGRSEDEAVVIKSSGLSTEQMAGYIPIGSSAGEFAALQIPCVLQKSGQSGAGQRERTVGRENGLDVCAACHQLFQAGNQGGKIAALFETFRKDHKNDE